MNRYRQLIYLIVALGFINGGCTVSEVIHAEQTSLDVASLKVAENLLLDVGILNFDAGIPEANNVEETQIYPEVREAEARYLPYHIKTTLQGTGFWGAVRVIPAMNVRTDVYVNGRIEKSDGEFISLTLAVFDVTGSFWFEETYSMQTGISSYAEYRDRTQDPYQKVFNDFANDLHAYVITLDPKTVSRIREVSELLFFADMAPDAFGDHLAYESNGTISLQRLPAQNDPMVDRLRQIRERDRLVVDTLNEHYANFYYGVALPYEGWRKLSREQAVIYRQTRKSAVQRAILGAAVVAGSMSVDTNSSSYGRYRADRIAQSAAINRGWRTIMDAFRQYQGAELHREEIKELSESFVAEAAPMVVQVEGETMRLTGTAEAQYESWRKLLKEIYKSDTGFGDSIQMSDPVRSQQPST